jgi:hypothetical protein
VDGSRSNWKAKLDGLPEKYKEADTIFYEILTRL